MKTKSLVGAIAMMLGGNALAGNLVDMQLLTRANYDYRQPMPTYFAAGQTYVAARAGQEFTVRLSNRSAERVLVVLSVDGVNAITGRNADLNGTGYVLQPYQTLDVDGWRKSANRTAAFYFTHIGDSYAARTGRPQNVGIVGAAVYREQTYYQPYSNDSPYFSDKAAPEAEASRSEQRGLAGGAPAAKSAPLGAGHGRQEYSPSVRVEFEREDQVYEIVDVRYDSYDNLLAMGVIPRAYYGNRQPQSFPNQGYVPDPQPLRYRQPR